MALSIFKPSRCVLLIGDESLYVYNVTARVAKLVDTVPWQAEDFEDIVTDLIRKECGGKPVLILNDMTDQHFKGGQRLPKVSVMDKANVLRRKLQISFPNYPIRGALPVKLTKQQREGLTSGQADLRRQGGTLYLFAAVPMSEPITKTIQAVRRSMASVAGFFLLPVEAADMVRSLAEKVSGKGRAKGKGSARWVVFVGQHQNGDLRQVVIRDGQLAMTRMTSVIDADSDAHVWAQEVYHEIKATIGYLSRFGYEPQDGTDMIVIAGSQAGEALQKLVDFDCGYHSFTAPEAARALGMSIGIQDDPRYADPLHVAWTGRKTKFILPMQAVEVSQIHRPRQAVAAIVFLLLLGAGYMSWQMMGQFNGMMGAREDLSQQRRVLAQVESEYTQEVDRLKTLGFDVRLIQGGIKTFDGLEQERIGILSLLKALGDALGTDLRIDALAVDLIEERPSQAGATSPRDGGSSAQSAYNIFDLRMTLAFPPDIDAEYGIREINNLERRLRTTLPDYRVRIERQVASPEYSRPTSGVAGEADIRIDDYVASLSVKGPYKND